MKSCVFPVIFGSHWKHVKYTHATWKRIVAKELSCGLTKCAEHLVVEQSQHRPGLRKHSWAYLEQFRKHKMMCRNTRSCIDNSKSSRQRQTESCRQHVRRLILFNHWELITITPGSNSGLGIPVPNTTKRTLRLHVVAEPESQPCRVLTITRSD